MTFPDSNPVKFAEKTWLQMLRAPFSPLNTIKRQADIDEMRPAFMERAIAMIDPWAAGDSVEVPTTQLWVQAEK